MGDVIHAGSAPLEPELSLTKREIGDKFGVSVRTIETLTAEGRTASLSAASASTKSG